MDAISREQLHAMAADDRIVGAALVAIHTQPAKTWTLASLAKHANSSRSVLAKRFPQLVGTTTMNYLAQRRMLLAVDLLSRSSGTLIQIAGEIGYETDTSFIRAFRRTYGVSPARWRRCHSATARSDAP